MNEDKIAFWGALTAAILFFVVMVLPIFSYAMTTDEVLCNCQKFMVWRGHDIGNHYESAKTHQGVPPVGSVAVWFWPHYGVAHVAEVVLVTDHSFWSIGSNERGCGLFLRETQFSDQSYQGYL